MELNFDKYHHVKTVYDGTVTERVDIPLSIVIDTLLDRYKESVGIDKHCKVVKLSEYTKGCRERSQKWAFDDYYASDITKLEELNVEYACIEEWKDSTPHGDIVRIDYGGEATEQDYKVQTALKRIEELL